MLKYIEEHLLEYNLDDNPELKLDEEDCGICQDCLIPLDEDERADDEKAIKGPP